MSRELSLKTETLKYGTQLNGILHVWVSAGTWIMIGDDWQGAGHGHLAEVIDQLLHGRLTSPGPQRNQDLYNVGV